MNRKPVYALKNNKKKNKNYLCSERCSVSAVQVRTFAENLFLLFFFLSLARDITLRCFSDLELSCPLNIYIYLYEVVVDASSFFLVVKALEPMFKYTRKRKERTKI